MLHTHLHGVYDGLRCCTRKCTRRELFSQGQGFSRAVLLKEQLLVHLVGLEPEGLLWRNLDTVDTIATPHGGIATLIEHDLEGANQTRGCRLTSVRLVDRLDAI